MVSSGGRYELARGRADQLVPKGLLVVALGLVLASGLGGPILPLVGRGSVTTPVELDGGVVHGVPHLVGSVQARVGPVGPAVGDRLLSVLPTAFGPLVEATVTLLLLRVARSGRRGEVFVRSTVRRLRVVALLIAAGGTALEAVDSVCRTEPAVRTGAATRGCR